MGTKCSTEIFTIQNSCPLSLVINFMYPYRPVNSFEECWLLYMIPMLFYHKCMTGERGGLNVPQPSLNFPIVPCHKVEMLKIGCCSPPENLIMPNPD